MLNETGYILRLIKRLLFLLVIYFLCRLLFYLFNSALLSDPSPAVFLHGIRFDIAALSMLNLPYIFLYTQPFRFRNHSLYQLILTVLFFLTNIFGIFWNVVDLEYFKFTLKRTTWDVFEMNNEAASLSGRFLVDFWYLPLIFLALFLSLVLYYRKTRISNTIAPTQPFFMRLVLFLVVCGLTFLGARGGLQLKPLHILHAGNLVSAQQIPLVLNTPFTLLKTAGETSTIPSIANKDSDFNPVISFTGGAVSKKNVVLIILESFSSEYAEGETGRIFTPYLNALKERSEFYSYAFANGKKSIEGIPAIVASIPSWSEIPFAGSAYTANSINSLASVLREKNYQTKFFHGATRGSMNLESFSRLAGFESYIALEDYPDKDHFDGHWGIFDEPFFRFFLEEIQQTDTPFFAGVFSLSSHHPFVVPDSLKDSLPEGKLKILQSIAYTDRSLKKFMEAAEKEDWYKNTLFVITADHTGPSSNSFYSGRAGMFRIPLLFFEPDKPARVIDQPVSQIDIFPMVLRKLNHQGEIFSMGSDSGAARFPIQFLNGMYQILDNEYLLLHDGDQSRGMFNYKTDSLLKTDLSATMPERTILLEKELSDRLSVYFNALNQNKMLP